MDLHSPMFMPMGESSHFHGMIVDGLSLQEMIDTDIKAEFDDIACGNASGLNSVDGLDLISDLDLKLEDGLLGAGCGLMNPNLWSHHAIHTTTSGERAYESPMYSNAFSNSYLEDMTGATSIMVNPNNVMPVHPHLNSNTQLSINTQLASSQSDASAASPGYVGAVTATTRVATTAQSSAAVIMTTSSPSNLLASGQHRGIKTVRVVPPVSSPLQQVPSPASPMAPATTSVASNNNNNSSSSAATTITNSARKKNQQPQGNKENGFPKPAYSYSCLIALALKNSQTGSMSVSEIYKFMCEHFPYFKTAPSGWKNSVRHNLSLNKCFEKIEKPSANGNQRKGCLWAMNPAKISKMDEEVAKWSRKDPMGIKKGMLMPETLESLERGELVKDYNANTNGHESEDDEDPRTPTSVSSQGSHYDSAGSDFVDVEGFTAIPDASLPELNIQASGGLFDDLTHETHSSFFHANYSIASVDHNGSILNGEQKAYSTIVLQKQDGHKIFSI